MTSRSVKLIRMLLTIGGVIVPSSAFWGQTRQFQFEQFPVSVYAGRIHIPHGLHRIGDGEWIGSNGKAATPRRVTFAGEFYLAAISCGTDCRYYQLTDLRTGTDIPGIRMFAGAEPLPVTIDGHPYLTILYFKPDSRLLIAEYHLDPDQPGKTETCRRSYFTFEKSKIRAISKTFSNCTEGEEP
jgi:hypothetical protein